MRSKALRGIRLAILATFAVAGFATQGMAGPLPSQSKDVHMGTGTCAESMCHGAGNSWERSTVPQNEYIIWSRQDKHSKAYTALGEERGQRIAKNLGIGDAQKAPLCLSCHTDVAAADKRGWRYKEADGVGCEACHGPAEKWLQVHVTGISSHKENVEAGMYGLEDPVDRAKVCVGCHVTASNPLFNHRLYGAGHPRIVFELDTFTATEPAHYRITDAYRTRKVVANGARTWAVGQAAVAQVVLTQVSDAQRNHDGIMPALATFDCFACHHQLGSMSGSLAQQPVGTMRINLSSLQMLKVVAAEVDPPLADRLGRNITALRASVREGFQPMARAAADAAQTVTELSAKIGQRAYDQNQMKTLLRALVRAGVAGEYASYVDAEQATMGIAAVLSALTVSGSINEPRYRDALAKLYEAMAKPETFKLDAFRSSVETLGRATDAL